MATFDAADAVKVRFLALAFLELWDVGDVVGSNDVGCTNHTLVVFERNYELMDVHVEDLLLLRGDTSQRMDIEVRSWLLTFNACYVVVKGTVFRA